MFQLFEYHFFHAIQVLYCKLRKFCEGFIFCETSLMRNFTKIKPLENGEITLRFTDVGKSCPNRDF